MALYLLTFGEPQVMVFDAFSTGREKTVLILKKKNKRISLTGFSIGESSDFMHISSLSYFFLSAPILTVVEFIVCCCTNC